MEISDSQFEHLVGLLNENRVAITSLRNDLMAEVSLVREEMNVGFKMLMKQAQALDEDVGKVQSVLRDHGKILGEHSQAFEGITQLSKTNFDSIESIQRHIHGEERADSHGAHDESALT